MDSLNSHIYSRSVNELDLGTIVGMSSAVIEVNFRQYIQASRIVITFTKLFNNEQSAIPSKHDL